MEPDYKKIGKRISDRRKALGMKQCEVEEKAGLSYKYLSNIERGISIPSIEVIIRLAIALETTPDEFLVGVVKDADASVEFVQQQLRTLSPKQLSFVSSLIPVIKEKV